MERKNTLRFFGSNVKALKEKKNKIKRKGLVLQKNKKPHKEPSAYWHVSQKILGE